MPRTNTKTQKIVAIGGAQAPPVMRDVISMTDFTPSGMESLLELSAAMKLRPSYYRQAIVGKQIVLFFEKPSLRTRLTFEAGIQAMGGNSFFFDQTQSRLGTRESITDMAHNLERWVDAIVLRTFSHSTVSEMAEHARIPVVNGLSDFEHPCQALADYMTLKEHLGDLCNVTLAYLGDGNNMSHSLMVCAALTGGTFRMASPKGFEPDEDQVAHAHEIASITGATIEVMHDPEAAMKDANAVYTDVWASMGQEEEANSRHDIFMPYQVNAKLMSHAAPDARFMHCLPAHRGDEVSAEVIDGPRSIVFDQAENRLHVQKAILLNLLGGEAWRIPPKKTR